MPSINFNPAGAFNSIVGGSSVLQNPTSIQFGPDGRLYVSEQNGSINAFTIAIQNGEYVATDHEELLLPNGGGVVKSIQNHNDDGSLGINISTGNPVTNRQVTGIVVTGTAANPVLYISSSDPRIANNGEVNLDTNSGVVTRVTWTGTEWEAVDIIRGLPRSEENHSTNGMVLSEDGTKLYLAVGGNTNNGAPSQFFSYTGEYTLSGTVLEIDLTDINSRDVLTDAAGGQNGTSRQYIYDLPTLDDPNIPNDGVRENVDGLDVAGPWGGNDGLNMAILPADAPLRIYADGLRNNYDLVLREDGKLYTVDNGSNNGLGGNPLDINGIPTDQAGAGEATNQPNDGGTGNPEPLFLLEDGGYYGHPAPARANQDLSWTVYGDDGLPDPNLAINTVSDLSSLVPSGVNIQPGFLIDPSKFTEDSVRLAQSGIRIDYNSPESSTFVNIGSSSNGLVEYTADAFDGALQGALLVAQFNGNVTLLNVNDAGDGLEPLIDPGDDEILGTGDDEILGTDGVYSVISSLQTPLDVTTGPDGTIWVASLGSDDIQVFIPSNEILIGNTDVDDDGIDNIIDPFIRDASNGGLVSIVPNQTYLWDFDANQDENLPGPEGYATGLTGVMIDGVTDFEEFFQEPSTLPDQIIKLDNVKFATAAGGGTTVIESVSNGNPINNNNDGEYLFHTGVTITPVVDTFTVKWTITNPVTDTSNNISSLAPSQQIGGYLGTGDQSNYLKLVVTGDPGGEIQILLEDDDTEVAQNFIAVPELFGTEPPGQIFLELEIDPSAATATPIITYETGNGTSTPIVGTAIDLTGTTVLDTIMGDYTVQGQASGLAVGLLSSNIGQSEADTFQAIFNDLEITATGDSSSTVLYRVNAGGPEIAAIDGGIDWSADTNTNSSPFRISGSNNVGSFPNVEPGATIDNSIIPGAIFDTERWDNPNAPEMAWAFDVAPGDYEVRLYMGNGFNGTNDPGERVFDVSIEGTTPTNLDDVDLSNRFGHLVGGVITNTVNVTDGTLDIEFIHGIQNPLINGIEILQLDGGTPTIPEVSIVGGPYVVNETDPQVQISLSTDVPIEEAVDVTFEIVPGSATPESDYEYTSATANFDSQTGIYTDTVTITPSELDEQAVETFLIDILPDTIIEGDEDFTINITEVSTNALIGVDTASVTIEEDDVTNVTVLFRVNAGGPEIAAIDGGIDWSADTAATNSPFLVAGNNNFGSFPNVEPGATIDNSIIPGAIFDTERWDNPNAPEMAWAFDVAPGDYEVRLYMGNGFNGTNDPGERVFDVSIEGTTPTNLDDVDLSNQFGHLVGGVISNTVNVSDGTLDIEFIHGIENPLINGIEILQLDGGTPTIPEVSIVGGPYVVNEADPQVQISLLTDVTVPVDETVDVTFEIVPDSANPEIDYEYTPINGSFDSETGIYTDTVSIAGGSSDVTFLIDILQDGIFEDDESFSVNITDVGSNAQIGDGTTAVTIEDDDSANGEAVLGITIDSDNVQISNFGSNSFQITNTGDKQIAQVNIDVTNALYPDTVFDPFGLAGDTATKALTIDTDGSTGVSEPDNGWYIGTGGSAGFEEIQLDFDSTVDGGFEPGETLGFSIDMDPNSIAGAQKNPLDAGSNPSWDVGGVSGAELIGSDFTVTFTDGSTATGQLQGVDNQAGSQALASQSSQDLNVSLTVNGLSAGGVGTYNETTPSVIVNGPAGQTARIVLTKGFIQPTSLDPFVNGTLAQQEFAPILQAQLDALALTDFPANNAVEFQTIDVLLTGEDQDISGQFNLSGVDNFNFPEEDRVPLGFVASVIDTTNNNLPLGSVTTPIYLQFEEEQQNEVSLVATQDASEPDVNGQFSVSLSEIASTDTIVSYDVAGTANADSDYTALSGTVTIPAGSLSAPIDVAVIDDTEIEGEETVAVTLTGATGDINLLLGAADTATVAIADDDVSFEPLNVEAENIANVTNYRVETDADAEGGAMLSFVGGASNETGSATFTFTGDSGAYNVILGVFDENDGAPAASLEVALNGTNIGPTVVLDQDPGNNIASQSTKVERTAGTEININNGDTITITGFESGNEHARFDFIRFEPVDSTQQNEVAIATNQDASEPDVNGQFSVSLSEIASTDTIVSYDVAGTATSDSDYTALSGTVTIPAGSLSAPIDVAVIDDTEIEGEETVAVTLTGATGDANLLLGAADMATVTINDDDVPSETLLLEAEAADTIVNYRPENIAVASGGSALSFVGGSGNEIGSASFNYDGTSDTYDIVIGTFDENDGEASFSIDVTDFETGITTEIGSVFLNDSLGSNIPNASTFVELTIASGIDLTPGDILTVNGFEDGNEHARIDYLQLVPVV